MNDVPGSEERPLMKLLRGGYITERMRQGDTMTEAEERWSRLRQPGDEQAAKIRRHILRMPPE